MLIDIDDILVMRVSKMLERLTTHVLFAYFLQEARVQNEGFGI